jgi:hypothetical protein
MVRLGALTSFHEVETACATTIVGRLAHRSSVYRKRAVREGIIVEARGWNSTQLLLTADGWKIASADTVLSHIRLYGRRLPYTAPKESLR